MGSERPERPDPLHAWLLAYCSPKSAFDCIALSLSPKQIEAMVLAMCPEERDYYRIMDMARRDKERGHVVELAGIFNLDSPLATLSSSSVSRLSHHPKGPASIHSRAPSHDTILTSPSRSNSKPSAFNRGWILDTTGPDNRFCSIGKSHSPYRFVRADFLQRDRPMPPTKACEELLATLEDVGDISSSQAIFFNWCYQTSKSTHGEWFWIIDIDNENVCDLLIADKPGPDQEVQNPRFLEDQKPGGQFHKFEAAQSSGTQSLSFHASEKTSTFPSHMTQSGQQSMHDAVESHENNSQQTSQQVVLEYLFGRTRREGSLTLNDLQGGAFMAQLSKFYASAHRKSPKLDRSAYQVKFTAVTEDAQGEDSCIYPLAESGFQRRWGKILRFVREYQDCAEFEVELLSNDADDLG